VARVSGLTDRRFLVAATTLAGLVSAERLKQGALPPQLADLLQIPRTIALAVAREARDAGVARLPAGTDLEEAVAATMWTPSYPELSPAGETG
jgi:malic enzyme